MTETAPSWGLYRTFLDVVRDGSLSAAARRLGLTQPTVGRHIAALERSIGAALFTRSQRGLLPTRAALELVPHAEAMAAAEAAFRRAASGEASVVGGSVRVTASEVMGCEVLPPILARFCAAHPAIEVELAVSNRVQDLLRRDADIAVRTRRPTQTALIARKIGTVRIGLFAHRSYIKARGLPKDVTDLAHHRLIGFDRDSTSFSAVGDTGWRYPGHVRVPDRQRSRSACGTQSRHRYRRLSGSNRGAGQSARTDPTARDQLPHADLARHA